MFCFIFVQGLKKPKSNLPLQDYSQDHKATVPSFLEPWIQYHDFRHRGLQLRIRIPIQNGRSEKACMALLCEHVFHAGELCSALHSALNFIGKGLMSYALQCESIAWKACPPVAAPLPSSSFEPWLRSLIRLTNVAKEHSFGTGGVHWWTCNLKILKFVQGKPRSNCGPYRDVQIGMEPSHFLVQHDFGGNNPFCTIYMCPACICHRAVFDAFRCLSAHAGRKKPMLSLCASSTGEFRIWFEDVCCSNVSSVPSTHLQIVKTRDIICASNHIYSQLRVDKLSCPIGLLFGMYVDVPSPSPQKTLWKHMLPTLHIFTWTSSFDDIWWLENVSMPFFPHPIVWVLFS